VAAVPVAAPGPGVGRGPGAIPVVPATGTRATVHPGSGPVTASPSPAPAAVEFLQLLAARQTPTGWVVDVRTAGGVTRGVTPGTPGVGGSLFYFEGEDEQAGRPTFVFTVGESEGGNLVPNAATPATPVTPGDSTLVLRHGQVDGGLSAA